ncbi:MAG: DUF2797 domain-containing protein [Candidatus Saccharimonadales bacterium]
MPPAGEYLLTNVGFSSGKPLLVLQQDDTLHNFQPLSVTLTLTIDTRQRFCVGWHDITTGQSWACPDHHMVDSKYEHCAACGQRTGFNPAFYYAKTVSPQQETRNSEAHLLYLAYFGAGVLKVGISHAARGHGRLLEQGARSALILDTFATAHIARQYEAKIASTPSIAETVLVSKKVTALKQPYDVTVAATTLLTMRQTIEANLAVTFAHNDVLTFDKMYFPDGLPDLTQAYDLTDQAQISGIVTGMLGSLLFTRQQDQVLFLPLKKYIGYRMTITYNQTMIALPARQIALF